MENEVESQARSKRLSLCRPSCVLGGRISLSWRIPKRS